MTDCHRLVLSCLIVAILSPYCAQNVLKTIMLVCLRKTQMDVIQLWLREMNGALGKNRTCDPPLRRGMLYPLSYEGKTRNPGIYHTTIGL